MYKTPEFYKNNISNSGIDIYHPIMVGDPNFWIPTPILQSLLERGLIGLNLSGLALRTRSKVVKQAVCTSLGYPIPSSFTKVQPRFFGQQLDTYTQKSRNLQIWNEELSPNRRYALIEISEDDVVLSVKVISGLELSVLDTTGTITRKYQAGLSIQQHIPTELVSTDTPLVSSLVGNPNYYPAHQSPIASPLLHEILPIQEVFKRLVPLIGTSFRDPGRDQERNRGEALHRLVCSALGYSTYEDRGQFPDIRHQLLEVKLQTSPTIDLGLVLPNSTENIDMEPIQGHYPRHCDARYAIFVGETDGQTVTLTNLILVTGADFFTRFRQFEGKVSNGKIQIPLPKGFFVI